MVDQTIGVFEPTSPAPTKYLDTDQVLNTSGTAVQQERVSIMIKDDLIHQYLDTMIRLLYDIRAQLAEFCPETPLLDIDVTFGDDTVTDYPT